MNSITRISVILTVALLFTGCAADRGAMIVGEKEFNRKSATTYFVVSAKNQQPGFTNAKDADLKSALEESLKKSGLYSDSNKANHLVDLDLYELEIPFLGLAPTVVAKINYKITNNDSSKKINNIEIISDGKASFFDGLTADLRVKVAVENAIKENFEKFINKISQ